MLLATGMLLAFESVASGNVKGTVPVLHCPSSKVMLGTVLLHSCESDISLLFCGVLLLFGAAAVEAGDDRWTE